MLRKLPHIILLLASYSLSTSIAFAYTIEDAVNNALKSSLNKERAEAGLKSAKFGQTGAYAGFLPKASYSNKFTKTKGKFLINDTEGENRGRTNTFQFSQSLFDGYQTIASVRQASANLLANQSNVEDVSAEVILGTIQIYEKVLNARDVLNLSEKNVQTIEEQRRLAIMRFKLGESTRTDTSQADSRLAAALAERERHVSELISSEAAFYNIVGENAPKELAPININALTPPITNLEEAVQKTRNNSKAQTKKFSSDAEKENVNIAISNILPKVDATISLQKSVDRINNANSQRSKQYALEVSAPLFNAPAYANIAQRKQIARQAKLDHEALMNQNTTDLLSTWAQFNSTREVIKSTKATIDAAQTALEGVIEEFKLGTRDFLAILNAEQELYNAKVQHRTAESNHKIAAFTLHRLLGTITKLDMKEFVLAPTTSTKVVQNPSNHMKNPETKPVMIDKDKAITNESQEKGSKSGTTAKEEPATNKQQDA